jgi:hypothetical protein
LDVAPAQGDTSWKRYGQIFRQRHLRDYKQENVDAASVGAGIRTGKYDRGARDAFDRDSTAAIRRARNHRNRVSGLYELFPASEPVLNSPAALPGDRTGRLFDLDQPQHHGQGSLRVLRNREGQPWIMQRGRQPKWMVVRVASFGKWRWSGSVGIFTVSIARRAEPQPSRARLALGCSRVSAGLPILL